MHKLREICLFEVDFNCWNKLIFAWRMMKEVSYHDIVPGDLSAKKKTHALYAMANTYFFRLLEGPALACGIGRM